MTTTVFVIGSLVIFFGVLTVGFAVEAPSWSVGVVLFVLLFPFALWLAYRSARSAARSRSETPGE